MPEDGPEQPGPQTRIAELAARLLRDAATFFDNVGDQNPELGEQMRDNAEVYRQVAALLEADPDATLGDVRVH